MMASTSTEGIIDRSKIPDYPEDLTVQGAAVLIDHPLHTPAASSQLKVHPQNLRQKQHNIYSSINVVRGAWEWGFELNPNDCLRIDLDQIWSGHRGNKNDNNSFNLYNRFGEIAFHISFRRHDQTIRFNAYSRGRGWGDESWLPFPKWISDERPFKMFITYQSQGSYIVNCDFCVQVDVDPCEPPNSLTYRSSNDNDAMFGQNVNTELQYYQDE
ncbi:hypothetical protein ASPACDRAFT_1885677 [Aspergillus aculeatus ATCC 16872]|uniref:Galectin n=1 Tax=Aspergillus aculeatus (strain ATCC 16872 / CBS 172.66 / WB 5094) TaxID=690307 RepID=A0A1L9X760_ASPA1|nr:uncharacterized protein ASPACDRAFT_1885677 [Aspergillus aculeatus ATCC 16872]OJK04267.1 hypothetical protein ASPACDRAFT_1885677 [Aspergillus aculeatus ATCC 16872]